MRYKFEGLLAYFGHWVYFGLSFYSQNTNMLPRKPKISYRYLKSGIEEFHRKYVLVPADKAANNVVVV